jgi:hypothetical protein
MLMGRRQQFLDTAVEALRGEGIQAAGEGHHAPSLPNPFMLGLADKPPTMRSDARNNMVVVVVKVMVLKLIEERSECCCCPGIAGDVRIREDAEKAVAAATRTFG